MNEISAEIKGHFLRLYSMAFTDSNFHVSELNMLYQFAEERGISRDDLDAVLTSPLNETKIPENLEDRIDYLYDFARMAWADGEVVEDERNTLKKYCKLFEIESKEIESFVDRLIEVTSVDKNISKTEFIKSLNL